MKTGAHPTVLARDRAHRRSETCPAKDPKKVAVGVACRCDPTDEDLAEAWAARARMAAARRFAGGYRARGPIDDDGNPTSIRVPWDSDPVDVEALRRAEG